MTVKKKRRKTNYVNNRDFHDAIVKYRKDCVDREKEGKEPATIPRYIGECIGMIANRYATKPNYSGYAFRDEMVDAAILNCFQYFNNYNPEKYDNPFAYFTQVIHCSFLRTIQSEKKKLYGKFKMMIETEIFNGCAAVQEHDRSLYDNYINVSAGSREYIENFINDFEKAEMEKKKKAEERMKLKEEGGSANG